MTTPRTAILALSASALAILGAAACDPGAPEPTPTTEGTATTVLRLDEPVLSPDEQRFEELQDAGYTMNESAFIITLENEGIGGTEDAKLNAAHAACDAFDGGNTFTDLILVAIGQGMDAGDAGFLIGAGTAAFCPQYDSKIPN